MTNRRDLLKGLAGAAGLVGVMAGGPPKVEGCPAHPEPTPAPALMPYLCSSVTTAHELASLVAGAADNRPDQNVVLLISRTLETLARSSVHFVPILWTDARVHDADPVEPGESVNVSIWDREIGELNRAPVFVRQAVPAGYALAYVYRDRKNSRIVDASLRTIFARVNS